MSEKPKSNSAALAPFFPGFDLAREQDLIDTVSQKQFTHTAAFLSRSEELCRSICLELLAGVSRRVVAKRYEVSRNSVNKIREIMEARGELEPLKKEIARRLDRCVIYSLENLEAALCDNTIAAASLPVATAVLLDKKAALEGMPTARIEHVTTRKLTHEDLNAWLENLPSAGAADSPAADPSTERSVPQLPPATEEHDATT